MSDFKKPSSIVKIIIVILAIVCYFMMIGFHYVISQPYERLILCAIFGGFMVLYIAIILGLFCGKEIDKDLNSVWSLYGFSAYLAAGMMCIILFADRNDKEAVLGLVTGALSILQSFLIGLEVWFMEQEAASASRDA